MTENIISAALIGMIATVGYTQVAEMAPDILDEASQAAAALQERELSLALELYYLKAGQYPTQADEAMVEMLYDADVLKDADVPFTIDYEAVSAGQRYTLEVS